jgi:hypothetical protein
MCPKFKCNTISVSFSACRCSSVVFLSEVWREKKKRLEVVLLCWGRWHCTRFLRPVCLFTSPMGSRSSPLSCGVFLPPPLSQAFLLLVVGRTPGSCPRLSGQAQLVYLQFREGFPSSSLRRSVRPTLVPACLFCSYCLLPSFSFFPGWGSVCPGGYADLAQACLWEYRGTAKLTLSTSSQAVWAQASGSPGALLVSPLTWSRDALHQLEVWRGQHFVSFLWFSLQGVSPVYLQDFTIGGTLSASSL